jgi:hypothetical protein
MEICHAHREGSFEGSRHRQPGSKSREFCGKNASFNHDRAGKCRRTQYGR